MVRKVFLIFSIFTALTGCRDQEVNWRFAEGEPSSTGQVGAGIFGGDFENEKGVSVHCIKGEGDIFLQLLPEIRPHIYKNNEAVSVVFESEGSISAEMKYVLYEQEQEGGKGIFELDSLDGDKQEILGILKIISEAQHEVAYRGAGFSGSIPSVGARKVVEDFMTACFGPTK